MILNRKRLVTIFKFFYETNFLVRHNCFQKNTEEKNKNIKIKKKKKKKRKHKQQELLFYGKNPFLAWESSPT